MPLRIDSLRTHSIPPFRHGTEPDRLTAPKNTWPIQLNRCVYAVCPLHETAKVENVVNFNHLRDSVPNSNGAYQCYITTCSCCWHVKGRLFNWATAIQSTCECAHRSGDHQELIDLAIAQRMVWRPHQRLQFFQFSCIDFGFAEQRRYIGLVPTTHANFTFVGQQSLLRWIKYQTVEKCVLCVQPK